MRAICCVGLLMLGILGCQTISKRADSSTLRATENSKIENIFTEHEPIVPSNGSSKKLYSGSFKGELAHTAFDPPKESENRVPSVEKGSGQVSVVQETANFLPKRETPLEEKLADCVKKLDLFSGKKVEDLNFLEKHNLFKLQKKALLLLLLTGKDNSEECRKILKSLQDFQLVSNLELEGLKFALYQRLTEYDKRDDSIKFVVRELAKTKGKRFKLENATFCKKILAYGQYINVDEPVVFAPGDKVNIYCEFAGAAYRSLPGGEREQQIQVYLKVFNQAGKIVDAMVFLKPEDGKRKLEPQEFLDARSYISGVYYVPDSLCSGRYKIQLSAKDLVTHEDSTVFLPFEVRK